MDNLFFDNDISVSITKSPINPVEGDNVTFTATARIKNITVDGYNYTNPTYFFSYTWLVSQDNGVTYNKIGADLETLTINNVTKESANYLYKVKVAVIDLNNMLLTEDGDNLTTQYGEILLNNNTNNILMLDNNENNIISDVPALNINQDIDATEVINIGSIIQEDKTYDPLIDTEAEARIYSLLPVLSPIEEGQVIEGSTDIQVSVPDIPEPDIEIPNEPQMYIQAQNNFKTRTDIGCGLYYNSTDTDCQSCISVRETDGVSLSVPNLKKITDNGFFTSEEWICCVNPSLPCSSISLAPCYPGDASTTAQWDERPCYYVDEPDVDYIDSPNGNVIEIPKWTTGTDDELNLKCGCETNRSSESLTFVRNSDGTYTSAQSISAASGLAALVLAIGLGLFVGAPTVTAGALATILGIAAIGLGNFVVIEFYKPGTDKKLKYVQCYKRRYLPTLICANGERYGGANTVGIRYEGLDEPPEFNCVCTTAEANRSNCGGIATERIPGTCSYRVIGKNGPPGGTCVCTLTNGPQNITHSYSMPNTGTPSGTYNIERKEFYDCFIPTGQCGSGCVEDGEYCCKNLTIKYRVIGGGSVNVPCNEERELTLETLTDTDVDSNVKPSLTIPVCDLNVTRDRRFNISYIRPVLSNEYGPGYKLYDSQGAAQNSVTSDIIVNCNMVTSTEKIPLCSLPNRDTIYSHYTVKCDTASVKNNKCNSCKSVYTVESGDDTYSCNDSNLPCGINAGCNTAEGSTPITKVTIGFKDNPSDDDLANLGQTVFETLDEAKAKAEQIINNSGKPGVVCSADV